MQQTDAHAPEMLITDFGECEIPPGSTPEQVQALADKLREEAGADLGS